MSNEERQFELVKLILDKLVQAGGYLMYESVLFDRVNLLARPKWSEVEFGEALEKARSQKWISDVMPPVGGRQWKITQQGRADRAEM